MASHPPGPCCVSGSLLTGKPLGTIEQINNTEVYVSLPARDSPNKSKAILFLTDACGLHLNSQLLADSLAASGEFTVIMPDLFHGDAYPFNNDSTVDLYKWLARHAAERVDPVVEGIIEAMRGERGFSWVGAVGYCTGAKYVIRWLKEGEGKIDAGFVAHPSFVDAQELRDIKGPLSIAAAGEINPPSLLEPVRKMYCS